jgi:hypothetical protein
VIRPYWKTVVLWIALVVLLFVGAGVVDVRNNKVYVPPEHGSNIEALMNLIRRDTPLPLPNMLLAILTALLFPPLPLIHAWLLAQVYRYAYQPGESSLWERFANRVTGIVVLFTMLALILWFSNHQLTFTGIVFPMMLFCMAIGAGGAVWIARKRNFSPRFTMRLAIAAGLVSLIAPFGVLGVYITWPVVLTGIMAYILFRGEIEAQIERNYQGVTRWQVDSLALVAMGALALVLGIIGTAIALMFNPADKSDPSWLIILCLLPFALFAAIMKWSMRVQMRDFGVKKKRHTENGIVSAHTIFPAWDWIWFMGLWGLISATAAATNFAGQMFAYAYFQLIL